MRYPVEAARILEQVSVEDVAALFSELPTQTGAPVMASMLPEKAAACLQTMMASSAAKLVSELHVSSATRIYRLLAPATQDAVSVHLADKTLRRVHHHMGYPPMSAGALLDPRIDMLPGNVTVAEAIRRIERLDRAASCEVYVIDDAHHLIGMLDLGKLLISDHHSKLKDIMSHKTQPLSAHASAETLLSHPGWATHRRLPVVERDNTLVGVLHYSYLQDSVLETGSFSSRDPLENLLSLASLYWLSVAQLLDSLLSIARPDKGERP
ncbi:magnesium transporter [Sulfuriflexus mobilis]|uniref:magnesium transporter n=1 Tax=Sulfuriflexus mobilis TaxID=1811807 RepID=UPI001558425B|nr:magnesium transporter [Sulfuriflexus mobilis]